MKILKESRLRELLGGVHDHDDQQLEAITSGIVELIPKGPDLSRLAFLRDPGRPQAPPPIVVPPPAAGLVRVALVATGTAWDRVKQVHMVVRRQDGSILVTFDQYPVTAGVQVDLPKAVLTFEFSQGALVGTKTVDLTSAGAYVEVHVPVTTGTLGIPPVGTAGLPPTAGAGGGSRALDIYPPAGPQTALGARFEPGARVRCWGSMIGVVASGGGDGAVYEVRLENGSHVVVRAQDLEAA